MNGNRSNTIARWLLRWHNHAFVDIWDLDVIGGIRLADGAKAVVVVGIDRLSRECVAASVTAEVTPQVVCRVLVDAMVRRGVPPAVSTDHGLMLTTGRGPAGDASFAEVCRAHGTIQRIRGCAHPLEKAPAERFGRYLMSALDVGPRRATVQEAQTAVDDVVARYNRDSPRVERH